MSSKCPNGIHGNWCIWQKEYLDNSTSSTWGKQAWRHLGGRTDHLPPSLGMRHLLEFEILEAFALLPRQSTITLQDLHMINPPVRRWSIHYKGKYNKISSTVIYCDGWWREFKLAIFNALLKQQQRWSNDPRTSIVFNNETSSEPPVCLLPWTRPGRWTVWFHRIMNSRKGGNTWIET